MKTKIEHKYVNYRPSQERGSALVYILIAIVLFAALGFTLSRQTNSGEEGTLPDDRAQLYATQLTAYAAQVKSAVDQMLFTGTDIGDLDFMDPSDASFNTGTQLDRTRRVFHPEGGGVIKARLPEEAVTQMTSDPTPGWYLGRDTNVEWTTSSNDDVILVAYQIHEDVCAKINESITGSPSIPVLGDSIKEMMIDDSLYSGTNVPFTTDPSGSPLCADCHELGSLCVQNQTQDAYGFYTIIADQ